MEVGSQAWIEHSLARLEELEQERDDHEQGLETASDADTLRIHSEGIERLDEEIKALYAKLESVAEDEDEADPDDAAATNEFQRDADVAAATPAETSGAQSAPADELPDNPFGAPAAAAPVASGFGESSGFGEPSGFDDPGFGSPSTADYDLDPPKGGAGKWIVLGLLVAGGGVGAFMYLNQKQEPEAAPAAPTEVRVIEAKAVPEDTQGPKAAKGADVDRTPGMADSKKTKRSRGGGGGSNNNNNKKDSGGKKIKLSDSDDPLG